MWVCHCTSSIEQEEGSFYQQIGLELTEESNKCYIWSAALCGTETGTLRGQGQKYLERLKCGAGD